MVHPHSMAYISGPKTGTTTCQTKEHHMEKEANVIGVTNTLLIESIMKWLRNERMQKMARMVDTRNKRKEGHVIIMLFYSHTTRYNNMHNNDNTTTLT